MMAKLLRILFTAAVALAITAVIDLFHVAEDIEHATIDLREIAFAPTTFASDRVVMVWLDEATMSALPYRSPVPRDFLKRLNDQLVKAKPAAIGYDIYFKDPSFAEIDKHFAASLARAPAYAVAPMRDAKQAGKEGYLDPPLDLFARSLQGVGLADLPVAAFDTKVRFARLSYVTDANDTPTFAALLYTGATGADAMEAVSASWHRPTLGTVRFTPFFGDGKRLLIRFAGPPSTIGGTDNRFRIFSARLVADGLVPATWFKDKIVLVGAAYDDLTDAFLTPYYGRSTGYARMNGVEIHANVLNQLMTGQFYYGLAPIHRWILIGLAALVCAAFPLCLSPLKSMFATLAVMLSFAAGAVYAFSAAGVVVPMVMPPAAALAAFGVGLIVHARIEGRQKRFIRTVFARYVPEAVVERISKHPELARLGGEERIVTSMFTDIASFTTMSERMKPSEVVRFLNDYLERMNRIIFSHDGTIDKYEGDAVIAFFNAPLDVENHQAHALAAAVEIQRASREVSTVWRDRLGGDLVTRIGIHTGRAIVGNLGSEGRFDYTAIGDTINLASRLEGANKFYGTRILASETTVKHAHGDIITRPVDRVRVKGRAEPVELHEVMGLRGGETDLPDEVVARYREAYADFAVGHAETALKKFKAIAAAYPEDMPTRVMLERSSRALAEPDWNRVTDLQGK